MATADFSSCIPELPVVPGIELRMIPGFPHYAAGSDGSIWSCHPRYKAPGPRPWRKMKPVIGLSGHAHVTLKSSCGQLKTAVSRVVLLAFTGAMPIRSEVVLHVNGNLQDNSVSNLRVVRKGHKLPFDISHCPPLPTEDGKEFRHIPGRLGYAVSDAGDVISCIPHPGSICRLPSKWRRLSQSVNPGGYMQASVSGRNRLVHQLVLFAFVGPRPRKHDCCHSDGNRKNNVLSNLRWGTRSENQKDSVRHGTHNTQRSETHPSSKITPEQVAFVRENAGKIRRVVMAQMLGLCKSSITNLINRNTWKNT